MLYSDIGFGVGLANVCILLILLFIYGQNYRKWKSQYTIGLLVFGIFLLIQNILSLGFLGPPSPPPGPPMISPLDLPLLLINISQLIALATLLKISYK